jgi:glycosyltransferase involved in cell wall biosynthesis
MLLSERELRRNRKIFARLLAIWEKILFKCSDGIIAISPQMVESIKKISNLENKVVLIPHILPKPFRNDIICKQKPCKNIIGIGFVGDLRAKHNLDSALFLIDCFKYIKKIIGDKDIKLYLVGSYDLLTMKILLNKIGKEDLQLNNQIIITGFIANLDDFICNNIDILVAPMFSMSGVSTKLLYYLRFKDKIIIASKEACEGLEYIVAKHRNVITASTPKEFSRKLLETILTLRVK